MMLVPQYLAPSAKTINSVITDGSFIEGEVYNSLLSSNVKVAKNAIIRDSIIFANTIIKEGAIIEKAIIDEDVVIEENAHIGSLEKSLLLHLM